MHITYTKSTRQVVFDVSGTNEKAQNVTASLEVYAYGNQVYTKEFDPCGSDNHVAELCPGEYNKSDPKFDLRHLNMILFM